MYTVGLCEDNDFFRESLEEFINETPNFQVIFSMSGARNLPRQLKLRAPHVILMDIDMEEINGIEATKIVKALAPQVSILMLTVYEDDKKIFDAILAGASGYLLKKTSPAKILEAVVEVCEGGASMSSSIVKKVLDYFSRNHIPLPTENDYTLSPKEKTILKCLVEGDSYKMIASNCSISIGTVRTHINNIYKKLHINSKSEAVAKALREHLT
jgi:DNA-binding NarL/FixJ family response regulator